MYRLCTGLSTEAVEKNPENGIGPMCGKDWSPERLACDKEMAFLHKAATGHLSSVVILLSPAPAKKTSLSC